MTTAIWWIRRDLRLSDNRALQKALDSAETIVPTFILDPAILNADTYSPARFAFMLDGLRLLDRDLRSRGSYLHIRRGKPIDELRSLLSESGANLIVAEADYSPYARRRDQAIGAVLPLEIVRGVTYRHPIDVTKKAGGHYTVFTPFKKSYLAQPLPIRDHLLLAPEVISSPAEPVSAELPTTPELPSQMPFVAGEAEAQRRLNAFVQARVFNYKAERDILALPATSSLSPYLRFGMLSARSAIVSALEAQSAAATPDQQKGAATWLSELIWREFYHMILFHYPHVRKGSYRPVYDLVEWREDSAEFDAWCQGKTGYPVVDAAMRQLLHNGWMHNRARMIVASFLCKDLLISWQWGERWFMQNLLDGDHAANNGGWQWTAGTGTDAAPYFRIFNPIEQGKRFDPAGTYVRRWVPELANVPDKHIHDPWTLPPMLQQSYDCVIGRDYPAPIVDHKMARQRTLAAYKLARESEQA